LKVVLDQIRTDRSLALAAPWQLPIALVAACAAALAALLIAAPDAIGWLAAQGGMVLLLVVGLAAICLLPGLALLRWLWPDADLTLPERLAVAFGVGAAVAPLLLGVASVAGGGLSGWAMFGYLALAIVALVWRRAGGAPPARMPLGPAHAALAALVLGLTLLARLYAVREQFVGANADSYHHTLIVQLFIEHGGLFRSWEPYAGLSTFSYHYGFHTLAAMLHWLTGVPVTATTLYTGQIMSAAAALAAYALASRLTGVPAAGIWAALLVGLVNLQPAYYAFWGRYTYVTSHVILAAALIIWLAAIQRPATAWRLCLLAAITTAGLAYTHYQTTILAALFLAAYLALLAARAPTLRRVATIAGRAALIGAIALAIFLPWLSVALSGNLDRNSASVADPAAAPATIAAAGLPAVVPFYLKAPIMALALGGVLLAARTRNQSAALLALWSLLIVVAAAPHLLGLPGTGLIEPVVAFIALYVTVAPLAAYPLGAAYTWAATRLPRLAAALAATAALALGAWSIGWQQGVVPAYARMVLPADMAAYAWVRANTPPDARFLVNNTPLYQGRMIVGVDGGWWLPLLAGRATNVPPMTFGSELCIIEGCDAETLTFARTLRGRLLRDPQPAVVDLTRPEALEALRAAGIRYVYSGAQPLRGDGTFLEPDHFDLEKLRASPAFRLVYAAGGVEIFEVLP
jgi:hypothetical protein